MARNMRQEVYTRRRIIGIVLAAMLFGFLLFGLIVFGVTKATEPHYTPHLTLENSMTSALAFNKPMPIVYYRYDETTWGFFPEPGIPIYCIQTIVEKSAPVFQKTSGAYAGGLSCVRLYQNEADSIRDRMGE